MDFAPAFEIATAPDEPQAAGVVLIGGINPATYSSPDVIVSINYTIRPPDPGVGYAF